MGTMIETRTEYLIGVGDPGVCTGRRSLGMRRFDDGWVVVGGSGVDDCDSMLFHF